MRTRVGYAGGTTPAPTYRAMGDHTEALQVDFDPALLSYEELLDVIWAEHDPSAPPRSVQYRSVILTEGPEQARAAEASRERLAARMGRAVLTPIEALGTFTRAEDYHQQYLAKNPNGYCGLGSCGVPYPEKPGSADTNRVKPDSDPATMKTVLLESMKDNPELRAALEMLSKDAGLLRWLQVTVGQSD